ncbi:MAG: hypothetical protein HC897_09215 [Thermoanaerobaculia bacterium]|nr:hypothetical protein [Thermoanaerobaculia bacterium]
MIGTDLSERIEAAWRYDGSCRVIAVWKGSAQPEDAAAVDVWRFAFNANPATQTTVTDPLLKISTYVIERDPKSTKPRIKKTTDDCPSCAMGANTERFYEDPAHPLLPTREVAPDGTTQLMTYEGNGQMISRVEALGTPLERETTYQYDSAFPAFLTQMEQPSTSGDPLEFRRLVIGRDPAGNEITREVSGLEDGLPFSYTTVTTNTPEGLPEVIDPPGYGTDDQTQWGFDPTRGDLVPMSRTDPVVGTSTFGHDPFNRQVSQTDPNGVTSEVVLDALDRPLFEIQRGATLAEDLVTEKRYTVFGDLELTILPRGNAILNSYDHAGRLYAVERKPSADPASHGERTLMELDDAGNVVKEELQRWDGSGWTTESTTERVHSTRCHADKVIRGAGSASPSTTEFAYDCKNRLQKIWDANHPSNGQTALASTSYAHDVLDRITSVSQPWGGTGGGTVTTVFEWDVQDHLERVIDPEGGKTLYEWSDRDLKTKEVSEVSGESRFSYNEHGEMEEKIDARGVVVSYTLDAADRVTFTDYPGTALDTVYTFDDPLVPFSKGRLTNVSRAGHDIPYRYDRFGRSTRDGALEHVLDKNGNRVEVVYPGGVRALYSHDYADREATLAVAAPGEPALPVVESASYLPMGPLGQLELGNGTTETHLFDERYYPQRIIVTGAAALLDWQYTVDAEGNPTAITDLLSPAGSRSYSYQDFQYYLTLGNGPWGGLSWEYDRIGSRKRETRGGVSDVYSYVPNAVGGNTAKLAQIALGAGGSKVYQFDAAGNQSQVTTGADVVVLSHDEANQLASIERPAAGVRSEMLYDGRSFLRYAEEQHPGQIFADGFETGGPACWSAVVGGAGGGAACPLVPSVGPVYSSDGVLHYQLKEGGLERFVFYFAGRPVLTLAVPVGGAVEPLFLAADHLGTPILASDGGGVEVWSGGFEPFGADFSGAEPAGLYLRAPGQWQDQTWLVAAEQGNYYYNLHRWYGFEIGMYVRADPGIENNGPLNDRNYYQLPILLFSYAANHPLRYADPLGLTLEDAFCVLQWTVRGGVLGLLAGSVPGCAVGGGVGVFAGGIGALPGCASGTVAGGLLGAGTGALAGAISGTLVCRCAEPGARRRRDKYTCEAKAHINNFSNVPGAPPFVFATGSGPTESTACQAAIRAVQQKSQAGTYTRHPRCTRCWRN